MKRLNLLILVALFTTSAAMAQLSNNPSSASPSPTPGTAVTPGASGNVAGTNTPPTYYGGDVLGAHNGYGRGCVMCHAPHGGAAGNGVTTTDSYNGVVALWGQNLSPLYGKQISFAGDNTSTKYPVTLPSNPLAGIEDPTTVILLCLSCHDGSTAQVTMMKGTTYEALPIVSGHAPTLFATTAGNTASYYANEHPVGPDAYVSCGAPYNWDCTGGGNTTTPISMTGTNSAAFLINNKSSIWNGRYPLANYGTTVNGVTCTTCHNQHSMNVYSVGGQNYTTMFFVKGYYNPYNGGNSVAQFCRNCHGGASNESSGLYNVPTT